MPITASLLYDLVSCPQRVALDAFGDPAERDEANAFVRLLWERGALFERETIDSSTAVSRSLAPRGGGKGTPYPRSYATRRAADLFRSHLRR